MKTKTLTAVLYLVVSTGIAQSTQFQYGYDAAGNRTERNMIVLQMGEPGANQAARSGDEQWPEEQAQAGLQREDLSFSRERR